MRSHGRILVSIWRDRDFIARSVAAQRCYMMLLAQKDINNAGVQPLMVRKWAKASEETAEADIVRALNELQAHRFVCYDTDTEELLIRSFIRNDGIAKQPNVLKNALRVAPQTESPRLRAALADELDSLRRKDASEVASEIRPEGFGNPFETLPGSETENPRSNPSETLPEGFNPSGTLREPCGDGVGEGVTKQVISPFVGSHSLVETSENNEKRMILIPDDWAPNDLHRAKYQRPDIDEFADSFRDHAASTGRRCHGRAGWDAAFSNWVRKSKQRSANGSTTDARVAQAQALKLVQPPTGFPRGKLE